jgi:hypothetical protein
MTIAEMAVNKMSVVKLSIPGTWVDKMTQDQIYIDNNDGR